MCPGKPLDSGPPTLPSRRRPHQEVTARAPHDHQLQLQLLGHQLHALAERGDLEPVAGVGQADDPAGGEWSGAAHPLGSPASHPSRVAYPTSFTEMTAFCTVTTEAPSSTMIREMFPLGPRRSWTLKVGDASSQMAAKT